MSDELHDELTAADRLSNEERLEIANNALAEASCDLSAAHRELDRAGAEPMPEVHNRVRSLARKLVAERDSDRVGLTEALAALQTQVESLNALRKADQETIEALRAVPARKRLPDERQSVTKHFSLIGEDGKPAKGYATVGFYANGRPGELFLKLAKQGSTSSGFADAFATAISMLLQYGVPLEVLSEKFIATRFTPAGVTGDSDFPIVTSVPDLVFRWATHRWGKKKEEGTE